MSTLNVSNITDGTTTVGTSYVVNGSAKAWLDYNQSGPTIEASLNTSSVTDEATGKFVQTFSNAMGSVNYSMVGMARGYHLIEDTDNAAKTATSFKVRSWYVINTSGGRANLDSHSNSVATFGDLA